MKNRLTLLLVWWCTATPLTGLQVVQLSTQDVHAIGRKIWKNECNCSIELLAFWNKNEAFPSFGIGHFIWFPANCTAPFTQTFPQLITYFKSREVSMPLWLATATACPWKNREEFYAAAAQPRVQELRTLLAKTIDIQAHFIVDRLNAALTKLIAHTPAHRHAHITNCANRLIATPDGCFALIDYLNFKGDGTNPKERYADRGWGLLQVLDGMKSDTKDPIVAFVASARSQLEYRVAHAPQPAVEQKFLPGWIARISTYSRQKNM